MLILFLYGNLTSTTVTTRIKKSICFSIEIDMRHDSAINDRRIK